MNVCREKWHVDTVSSACMDVNGLPQVLKRLSLGVLWLWRCTSPCEGTDAAACMYTNVCKALWRAGPKWWCNGLAGVLWNLASSLLCFLCTARVSYPTTSSAQHAPFNSPDHNRAELNHTRHHEYPVLQKKKKEPKLIKHSALRNTPRRQTWSIKESIRANYSSIRLCCTT